MRKILALLALLVGFAPILALAQVPPAVPALPDAERRTSYAIVAATGPYDVGFAIYGDGTDYGAWVEVWLDGTRLAPVTGWTLALSSGTLATAARPLTNARITLTGAGTGTLQIVGARRPMRTSQFNENAGISARNMNQVITDLVAQNRETWDKINDVTGRGLFSQPGGTLSILPAAAARANQLLGFDSSGQPALYAPIPSNLSILALVNISGSSATVLPALNTAAAIGLTNTNLGGSYGAQLQFGSVAGNPYAVIGTRLVTGPSPYAGMLVFAIKDDPTSPLVNRLYMKNGGQVFAGDILTKDFGGRYSFGAYNAFGYQAFLGYSQTSDLVGTITAPLQTAGGYFIGNNNRVLAFGENPGTYGVYAEGRVSNAGGAVGAEFDIQNTSNIDPRVIDPNAIFGTGAGPWSIGVWVSTYGTDLVAPRKQSSAAIGINKGPPLGSFEKGIVFEAGSVIGATGHSQVLAIPALYEVAWYAAGGSVGRLTSDATIASLSWDTDASSAQFTLGTSGTTRAVLYADATQSILAAVTSIPFILKTNNTERLRIAAASNHLAPNGTAPALTSCGTSPAISGTDVAGEVTMGTGAPTGCVITFNVGYTTKPYCTVSWQATPLASQSYDVATTTITLTQTATSSNKVNYDCKARPGSA